MRLFFAEDLIQLLHDLWITGQLFCQRRILLELPLQVGGTEIVQLLVQRALVCGLNGLLYLLHLLGREHIPHLLHGIGQHLRVHVFNHVFQVHINYQSLSAHKIQIQHTLPWADKAQGFRNAPPRCAAG